MSEILIVPFGEKICSENSRISLKFWNFCGIILCCMKIEHILSMKAFIISIKILFSGMIPPNYIPPNKIAIKIYKNFRRSDVFHIHKIKKKIPPKFQNCGLIIRDPFWYTGERWSAHSRKGWVGSPGQRKVKILLYQFDKKKGVNPLPLRPKRGSFFYLFGPEFA